MNGNVTTTKGNTSDGNAEQGGGGHSQTNTSLPFMFGGGANLGGQSNAVALLASLGGANGLTPASLLGMAGTAGQQQSSALLNLFGAGNNNFGQAPRENGTAPAFSIEDQILQRASALRAEALRQHQQQQQLQLQPQSQDQSQQQRQQQQQQQQQQLEAALAALNQQRQMSALQGLDSGSREQQEALLARATALRDLGLAGMSSSGANLVGAEAQETLQQQLDAGHAEDMERTRRLQMADLVGTTSSTSDIGNKVELQGNEPRTKAKPSKSAPKKSHKVAVRVDESTKETHQPQVILNNSSAGDQGGGDFSISAAEKTREELKRTPGTVIVPCRGKCLISITAIALVF
jgi:hydroxypyruvate isomerase